MHTKLHVSLKIMWIDFWLEWLYVCLCAGLFFFVFLYFFIKVQKEIGGQYKVC